MRFRGFPVLLFVLFLAACNGDDGPTAPAPGGGSGGGGSDAALDADARAFVPVVFGVGASASQLAVGAMQDVAQAVFTATRALNAPTPVVTGTVTQTGPGSLDLQYAPTPADRLVLQPLGRPAVEIFVTAFDLDPNVAVQAYVDGDFYVFVDLHARFAFRYEATEGTLVIDSASPRAAGGEGTAYERDAAWTRTISGSLRLPDGATVTLDLTDVGTRSFSLDPGASDATDESSTITGTATWNGNAITVAETSRFQQERDVTSLDGTPQRTVQVLDRTCSSTGSIGGRSLRFVDARVRSALRDGRVNEPAVWIASGSFLVDGRAAGPVRFAVTPVVGDRGPTAEIGLADGPLTLTGATLGG